jgi:hypothetical protein
MSSAITPQSEISQRVLAVLYLQREGEITSDRGHAIARLHSLMAGPKCSRPHVASAVRNLEFHNLVVRDNRPYPNASGKVTHTPYGDLTTGVGCYTIALAVEKDEVKRVLRAEFIEELQTHIAHKMAGKVQGAAGKKAAPGYGRRDDVPAPPTPRPVAAQPAAHSVNDIFPPLVDPDPDDVLARKVLEQLVTVITAPPPAPVEDPLLAQRLERAQDTIREMLDARGTLESRIADLTAQLDSRDRVIGTLNKRVNDLGDENESMRRALRNRPERQRTGHLTQTVLESLKQEDREALGRMATERPGGAGSSGSRGRQQAKHGGEAIR